MIQVKDFMFNCPLPEGGDRLFKLLDVRLSQEESVTLDFKDVLALPSMFLSTSFGQAAQKYGLDTVRKSIRLCNVTKGQACRIKEYFDRLNSLSKK